MLVCLILARVDDTKDTVLLLHNVLMPVQQFVVRHDTIDGTEAGHATSTTLSRNVHQLELDLHLLLGTHGIHGQYAAHRTHLTSLDRYDILEQLGLCLTLNVSPHTNLHIALWLIDQNLENQCRVLQLGQVVTSHGHIDRRIHVRSVQRYDNLVLLFQIEILHVHGSDLDLSLQVGATSVRSLSLSTGGDTTVQYLSNHGLFTVGHRLHWNVVGVVAPRPRVEAVGGWHDDGHGG